LYEDLVEIQANRIIIKDPKKDSFDDTERAR